MDLLSDHKGEIIVVDNNSTDSTNRLSHELADKVVFAKTRGLLSAGTRVRMNRWRNIFFLWMRILKFIQIRS